MTSWKRGRSGVREKLRGLGLAVVAASAVGAACTAQPEKDESSIGSSRQAVTNKGFPTNTTGAAACATCMKVTSVTQSQMNTDIQNVFNTWKSTFAKTFSSGTLAGKYYIAGGANGSVSGYTAISSSEAMGYGMMISRSWRVTTPTPRLFSTVWTTYERRFRRAPTRGS